MSRGLQKFIAILLGALVIGIIVFGLYKIFLDKGTTNVHFDRNFILSKMETARVDDEVYVKLIDVVDDRCKGDEQCLQAGEMYAKVLVINNHGIKYVKLGTVSNLNEDLKKLNYLIELIEISDDLEVTLRIKKLS